MKFEIIGKDAYRSRPFVNLTDDMYRVVITCKMNDYYGLRRWLDSQNGGGPAWIKQVREEGRAQEQTLFEEQYRGWGGPI